jgi:hypothetical protein
VKHRARGRNVWLDALHGVGAEPASPGERLRALEAIARHLQGGAPPPTHVRAWFARSLLQFVAAASTAREGAPHSLDAALGLRNAALPANARRLGRDSSLRFIAHTLPGSPWQQATALASVVHGTGVAPTEETRQRVAQLREEHGHELPRTPRQMHRILKG